jgi:hypothetical protein
MSWTCPHQIENDLCNLRNIKCKPGAIGCILAEKFKFIEDNTKTIQNNGIEQTCLCPLCNNNSALFYQNNTQKYHQCANCYGIFVDHKLRPDKATELSRYKQHNNDVEDKGYQKFVSPITSSVMHDFTPNDTGLDFGAGTGPVISKILNDNNFQIVQYDPFFHDYPELLDKKYNYIACCEVIEHFYNPAKEFSLLKNLLQPGGKLYCMTDIYNQNINFDKWYYKNDPTHVFIYQRETINWIKENFRFSNVKINGRLVTYSN